MQYVEFGSMKRQVSRFGMGCMRLPMTKAEDGREIIDEKESINMIRYAIDHGVNYFDTAYGYPGSEVVLGKALKDGYREKVMIATKIPMGEVNDRDSFNAIFKEQLARLQTEYVDVYIFHCLDKPGWEKIKKIGGIKLMEDLKNAEAIRNFGFSIHSEYEFFKEVVDAYPWDMCLIQLNILDRDHQAGVKGLKYAADRGLDVVIMEPLKGGNLLYFAPPEVDALLEGYPEKRSLAEWAFRWLYSQKEVKVILSGVSTMEQLKDNLRIFENSETGVISGRDMELIDKVKEIFDSRVKVKCTGCRYCMPCPNGVNIPEIFKVYNDIALSRWSEFGRVFYSLLASHSGKDAANCTGCGRCAKRCPQGINIPEMLKEAHAVMKR